VILVICPPHHNRVPLPLLLVVLFRTKPEVLKELKKIKLSRRFLTLSLVMATGAIAISGCSQGDDTEKSNPDEDLAPARTRIAPSATNSAAATNSTAAANGTS